MVDVSIPQAFVTGLFTLEIYETMWLVCRDPITYNLQLII